MPFKKILIGMDGSEISKKAALEGIRIAEKSRAAIFMAYIIPVGQDMIEYFKVDKLKSALKKSVEEVIEQVKTEAQKKGIPFNVLIREGNPSELLVQLAEKHHCDLIILGRRGKSTLEKILVGSVAERVVGESSVPVMLVPI